MNEDSKNRIENLGIFSEVSWELIPLDDGTLILKYIVKESIQKEGLHNPLITVKCTRQQLKGQKAKWGKELNELPFWIAEDLDKEMLVIWGGSNRLYAAIELGYTHVDCVMIPTFEEARKLQKTHRSTHPQLYAHDWRK